jgi:hypothetical protein
MGSVEANKGRTRSCSVKWQMAALDTACGRTVGKRRAVAVGPGTATCQLPENGPLVPKASLAKRSPMRRWVAASGWSWSGSGNSAASSGP